MGLFGLGAADPACRIKRSSPACFFFRRVPGFPRSDAPVGVGGLYAILK